MAEKHPWNRSTKRTAAEQREADKITLMRQAKTNSTTVYGMGGLRKTKGHQPKKVNLATVNIPDDPE